MARSVLPYLALLCVFALSFAAGVRGVDFGNMWDEDYQIEGLRQSVTTQSAMPDGYYYGGLYYLPGYLVLAPKLLRPLPAILREIHANPTRPFAADAYPSLVRARDAVLRELETPRFKRRDRRTLAFIAALGIVWVYLASRVATGSRWAGLASAAVLGFSFELSYHARWIAVDAMLAQFTALVLLFAMLALDATTPRGERAFLRCAAIAAGLGTGAKLPGVFLLVPIVAAIGFSFHMRRAGARLLCVLEVAALAFGAMVLTTPGVLLDPLHFAGDLLRTQWEYNHLPLDWPYSVADYWPRLGRILTYEGLVMFSPRPALAASLTVLALTGAFVAVRERRPKLLAVLAFLVLYIGFVSLQRLMIVRNFMCTLPPLAILVAVGLQRWLLIATRFAPARALLLAGFIAISALDAHSIWRAASTVGTTTPETVTHELARYLQASPERKFFISEAVARALRAHEPETLAKTSRATWEEADEVVLDAPEMPGWRANTFRFARYFTMQHANFDYYPGMLREPALIALRKDRAEALGVHPEKLE